MSLVTTCLALALPPPIAASEVVGRQEVHLFRDRVECLANALAAEPETLLAERLQRAHHGRPEGHLRG